MDQPPTVAFTAFADLWPRATETEIGAALCTIGAGRTLTFDFDFFTINLLKSKGFQRYLEEDIDQIFLGQLIWQRPWFSFRSTREIFGYFLICMLIALLCLIITTFLSFKLSSGFYLSLHCYKALLFISSRISSLFFHLRVNLLRDSMCLHAIFLVSITIWN